MCHLEYLPQHFLYLGYGQWENQIHLRGTTLQVLNFGIQMRLKILDLYGV